MALFANIETTTDSACIMLVMTDTASLARVLLAYCNNADAFKPCLIGEHLKYAVKRPFMKMLVTTASPVFVASDVLQVTHDDRGNTTSIGVANKRFNKTVEQVVTLTRPLFIQCARLF